MANTIKLKRGSGSDPSASDLVVGELAIRTDSGKIFTKKDNGTVAEISGGGGIDDGDKGDITVSNGGDTFTIDNGVVTSAKIADGTIVNADINASAGISFSKMSALTANTIVGRRVSNGAPQELTAGQVRTILNVEDGATADQTASEIVSLLSGQNVTIGEQLVISATTPNILFTDTNNNPDYRLKVDSGALTIEDAADNSDKFVINSDGHIDIINRLDAQGGLAVTGSISVSGTVDGVDVATVGTRLAGLVSGSSGVLLNGVTATTQGASDNTTKVATTAFVSTAISNLVDSSPDALNTLNELAAALGDDANFSTTVTNSIATKLPLAGGTLTGDLTISSTTPIINLTDTDHNSDYQIKNGNGEFNIKDVTNSLNRLTISASGAVSLHSGVLKLGTADDSSGHINSFEVMTFNIDTDDDDTNRYFAFYKNGANGSGTELLKINESGNVTLLGTVDGRDVAADGTKLDGIATGATNVTNTNQLTNGAGFLTSVSTSDIANDAVTFDKIENIATGGIIGRNNSGTGSVERLTASEVRAIINVENGATADQTAAEILTLIKTVDGSGSGLDSDKLDGQEGSYYRNASNLNAGTIPDARIPDTITPATLVSTTEVRTSNGTQLILNAGESNGKVSGQSGEYVYVNAEGGLNVNTPNSANVNWQGGTASDLTLITGTAITINGNTVFHTGNDGSGSGLDADKLDGVQASSFLRSDANDNASGTIVFTDAKGIRLSHTNQTDENDGRIAAGTHGSGLNIVGTRTASSGNRQVRIWGDVITDGGDKFWNAGNDGSGSGLDADKLDGVQASSFLRSDAADTATGKLTTRDIQFSAGYHLQRSNHHTGFLEGSYTNIGNNSTKTNPIYSIGSSYNPDDATLSNFYGIGFTHTNASFISFTGASAWGLYVAADGDARVWLGGSNGVISSTGNHYVGSNRVLHVGDEGSGGGLDADTVDGIQGSSFLRSDANDTSSGVLTLNRASSDGRNLRIYNTTNGSSASIEFSDNTGQAQKGFIEYLHADGNSNSAGNSFHFDSTETSTAVIIDQTAGNSGFYVGTNKVWHQGNDGSGSGLDSDKLDGQEGSYYRNAGNINAGTINKARLPSSMNGTTFTGDLRVDNDADLRIGDGAANERILIQKADNNVSDHIIFYNGTTRIGEIGCEDTTWLRINQETAKNIYTPRYIRADAGFFVDGTSKGINGSGNFIGGTISGASDYGTLIRSNANDNVTGHTEWQDNYQVRLGNGADMRLYHNASNSYIDNHVGSIYIRNAGSNDNANIYIQARDGEHSIICEDDADVRLFSDNTEVFRTDTTSSVKSKHFYPWSNNAYDLGSSSLRWRNLYVNDMHFSNHPENPNSVDGTWGDWTLQEGESDIFMINNRSGKKFKIAMIPV